MLYYIRKCVNDGYGQPVAGFDEAEVAEHNVDYIWSLHGDDVDESLDFHMETTGFSWNVVSDEEEQRLQHKLQTNGLVVERYEDYTCGLGVDREQVLAAVLSEL